jgi:RNA polymerase sigma-70 factor (ECF subfamily)
VIDAPPTDPNLAEWAQQVQSGDLDAFEALYRHLYPMLTRVARSLAGSTAEADDAVQETFVRLWEQRQRIDPSRSVRALLITAVRNRIQNQLRDTRRRNELLTQRPVDDAATTDDTSESASLADRIRSLMAQLPERQRTALALTRFDGLSHAEVAEAMGCSMRTVNNHIVRGLSTLRDRLRATHPDVL